MTPWLLSHLACPVDHNALTEHDGQLVCRANQSHSFDVVDGIPILLRRDVDETHPATSNSLKHETLRLEQLDDHQEEVVDWYVQEAVPATCGYLYKHLQGRLRTYPIPDLRMANTSGNRFLDIGCNWGRWLVAAGKKGYLPVGIDVNLSAALAARRVAASFGFEMEVVVADARYLPFCDDAFDVVFSYSVIQHFSKPNARLAITDAGRVLAPSGTLLIQMPNRWGLRSLQHQLAHLFKEPGDFDVRYWSPNELVADFERLLGFDVKLEIDGFFGLGVQPNDTPLLARRFRIVVKASEALCRAAQSLPQLLYVADSLYIRGIAPNGEDRIFAT